MQAASVMKEAFLPASPHQETWPKHQQGRMTINLQILQLPPSYPFIPSAALLKWSITLKALRLFSWRFRSLVTHKNNNLEEKCIIRCQSITYKLRTCWIFLHWQHAKSVRSEILFQRNPRLKMSIHQGVEKWPLYPDTAPLEPKSRDLRSSGTPLSLFRKPFQVAQASR